MQAENSSESRARRSLNYVAVRIRSPTDGDNNMPLASTPFPLLPPRHAPVFSTQPTKNTLVAVA